MLHGFAGYFETTLYKDVTLSKLSVWKKVWVELKLTFDFSLMFVLCVCGRHKTRYTFTWDVLLVPHPLPSQSEYFMSTVSTKNTYRLMLA